MSEEQQAQLAIVSAFESQRMADAEATYRALLEQSVVVDGHDLAEKEALIGVPFIVTAVVYRDGVPGKAVVDGKLTTVPTNYVSAEIMIGTRQDILVAMQRKRITPEQAERITPLEKLVINDGSTGIMRQLTAYLVSREVISVPDGPEGGSTGESRYDVYRASWVDSMVSLYEPGTNNPLPSVRFDLTGWGAVAPPLHCPRGLRRSDYDAGGQTATTYYLA